MKDPQADGKVDKGWLNELDAVRPGLGSRFKEYGVLTRDIYGDMSLTRYEELLALIPQHRKPED